MSPFRLKRYSHFGRFCSKTLGAAGLRADPQPKKVTRSESSAITKLHVNALIVNHENV